MSREKTQAEPRLLVAELQRFCMHDGPGVRTTVFFKGCPLRCAWCHNPETQRAGAELLHDRGQCIGCGACAEVCPRGAHRSERAHCIACGACTEVCPTGARTLCGREMTVEEILTAVERDRAFYGTLGGITLSGGEPFSQGTAVPALLNACRAKKISTAVETCGYTDPALLRAAVPLTDLFLWDLKDTNEARHRRYTGVSNTGILQNLALVNELGARIRLRCILVNGVNTETEHYTRIAEIARTIKNLDGVELIPYHAYAGSKNLLLGAPDNGRREWIPTEEQMARARSMLAEHGICVL